MNYVYTRMLLLGIMCMRVGAIGTRAGMSRRILIQISDSNLRFKIAIQDWHLRFVFDLAFGFVFVG